MNGANDRITAPALALLAALLVWQLLVPPIVGLADQGDFDRLWRWFGIESGITDPEQRYFRYLIREWRIDPRNGQSSGFVSADLLFVAASVRLNSFLSEAGTYELRTLAAVRIAFLLFVAFLLMRAAGRGGLAMRVVAAIALLVVVADVGYIAYFNSGFTEPGALLFGLLTIALFVRLAVGQGNRALSLVAFVASGMLLIWSKPQNVLLAMPLAFLAWRLAGLETSNRWRAGAIAGAVMLFGGAVLYRAFPPPVWYTQQIRHIAVFNSLLLASPDPAADLRALGVDPRWASLAGRFPWDSETQRQAAELQAEFHARVGDGAIVAFYLRTPERILPLLKLSAAQALAVRVGLGQFEASSGRPPFSRATAFALRSDFVREFGPHRFRWIVALLGVAVLVACVAWRAARTTTQRLLAEGVFMLAAAAIIQYLTVAVLQGPVAVSKGMLLFAFFYDATIVAAVAIIVYRAAEWRRAGKHRNAQKERGAFGAPRTATDEQQLQQPGGRPPLAGVRRGEDPGSRAY